MSKKMTAVDWLVLHLNKQEWFTFKQKEFIKQAKAMEKEQIIEAHKDNAVVYEMDANGQAEQYYTETYEQ